MKLGYKQIVAIIYTMVLFLDRLDLTIVNITLPTVAKYFGVSIVATDWISMSFLLALAVSIPISGWLGERFGFKKIYVISMLLFGMGSTLCAWAPNLDTLILLRFVQGIGGGMLIPVGMTMIYRIYDKSEYASITSYTFLPSLIAPAIAPFFGGVLLVTFGWRFVFLFSGPICLILALIAMVLLKEEPHRVKNPLDWGGFILSSLILIDIFYTLSLLDKVTLSPVIIFNVILLVPLIYAFIKCERKTAFPLINLRFFKNEIFVKANLIQLCFQVCHFGAIFLVGMFLQVGIGFSAIIAGLIMGMQAIGAMATSRYSARLFNVYGPKIPISIGLAGVAILSPCILLINNPHLMIFGLALFFIRGIFSGLCGTPIQTLSVIGFHKEEMSSINSIFNACRQVSISFGVAVSSILMGIGLHFSGLNGIGDISPDAALKVFGLGFWAIPIVAIIGIIVVQSLKLSTEK